MQLSSKVPGSALATTTARAHGKPAVVELSRLHLIQLPHSHVIPVPPPATCIVCDDSAGNQEWAYMHEYTRCT